MITLHNVFSNSGQSLITACDEPQISTWGMFEKTTIEAPVYIGNSQIETEYIGAFTFINLRSVHHETTNCAIECKSIGRFCMFAHSINIGFAGHPTDFLSNHLVFRYDSKSKYAHDFIRISGDKSEKEMKELYLQSSKKPLPVIGNDVWIGYGATVLNGVTIGDGAIIAAGSVVTKSIPPYSIAGGNPAKVIRYRFEDKEIEILEGIQWWKYGPDILHGIDLSDVKSCLPKLVDRVESGEYKMFNSPKVVIDNKSQEIVIDDE